MDTKGLKNGYKIASMPETLKNLITETNKFQINLESSTMYARMLPAPKTHNLTYANTYITKPLEHIDKHQQLI